MMPPFMNNKGTYTASLGNFCRWLAGQAEALGVEIFPGFAAAEVLFNEDGSVKGVATGDMGVARDGTHRPTTSPEWSFTAATPSSPRAPAATSPSSSSAIFDLERDSEPQVYGIGLKELWDIEPGKHEPGRVIHTQGWPLDDAWGGGFLYHQENGQVALGFVVALNYRNPHLSPFEEFQRWKQHPAIREILEGGRRVSYGARAINEGGWQAVPKLAFPGGALIGCAAGFVNVPRIKGSHTAMKSGMLAAEAAFAAIAGERGGDELTAYEESLRNSWIATELKMVRNVEPFVAKFGGTMGTLLAGIDMWMRYLRIGLPFTLRHHPDNETLYRKDLVRPIDYPKPDGVISFDRLSSVFISNTNHEEDQPVHLTLKDAAIPTEVNLPLYDGPGAALLPGRGL